MTTREHQNPDSRTLPADAPGAVRPLSPGILAVALLLALTASVATAGVIEGSDPARFDRREAPRELTVRWLSNAVARAARDLASTEAKAGAATAPINNVSIFTVVSMASPVAPSRGDRPGASDNPTPDGWPAQGLLNLPPPSRC